MKTDKKDFVPGALNHRYTLVQKELIAAWLDSGGMSRQATHDTALLPIG